MDSLTRPVFPVQCTMYWHHYILQHILFFCMSELLPHINIFILCLQWLLFMCWWIYLIFSCSPDTTVFLSYNRFLLVTELHVQILFPLSLCFVSLQILNIFQFQGVTNIYGLLILYLLQNIPHVIPYKILVVIWVSTPVWYRYLMGSLPCISFSVYFELTHRLKGIQ